MGLWIDLLMLSLALGTGWLGWVLLTLSGRRPLSRRAPARAGSPLAIARPRAVDSER